MKRTKYVLSGLAVLVCTALFLFAPTVYYRALDHKGTEATLRQISLEQSEQSMTPQQTIQHIYSNGSNSIYSEIEDQRTKAECTADCRTIIPEVFGPADAPDSAITVKLLDIINNATLFETRTYKMLTLSGNEIISFNIVVATFDDLYIYYEQKTKMLLELAIYDYEVVDAEPYGENEYSEPLYHNTYYRAYYAALGLENWKYESFAGYDPKGTMLHIGLFGINETDPYRIGLPIPR